MIDHQILSNYKAGIDLALRRGKPVLIQRRVTRAFGAAEAGIGMLKQLAQPILRIRITRFSIAQEGAPSALQAKAKPAVQQLHFKEKMPITHNGQSAAMMTVGHLTTGSRKSATSGARCSNRKGQRMPACDDKRTLPCRRHTSGRGRLGQNRLGRNPLGG